MMPQTYFCAGFRQFVPSIKSSTQITVREIYHFQFKFREPPCQIPNF